MSIIIRPAQKKDAISLAPLIYSAIEDLAEHFTGALSIKQAIDRLTTLIAEEGNRFSYQYGLVAEENGNIIGIGTSYPENVIDELTFKTIELSKEFSWYINKEKENRLLNDKEAPKGTFYIDHLAIDKDYRGKGYAKLIIEAMENKGRELGYKVVSLLVDINNPKARALYEKIGYRFLSDVQANGQYYAALVKTL